jgi:UDP-N-acetylglucosamine 1-carboxyvinyltransferase
MKQLIIHGGKPLQGDVWIGGAKNSTVSLIPASILSRTAVTLEGVPRISDVDNLMDLVKLMNVSCEFKNTTLKLDPSHIKMHELPADKIKSMRASYYFMGALLGRFGQAVVGFPGGDDIGPRPIDQHIKGFEALGASVDNEDDQIIIQAPPEGLHGAHIVLAMPSVGATVNIIMASVTAQGQTVIRNAAKEPEIIDLATFLNNMGAHIRGAGTDTIRIDGVPVLAAKHPHTIIPDRIEAGTYVSLAACIGNGVRIHNIITEHLDSFLAKVEEMGVVIDSDEDSLYVYPAGDLKMVQVRTEPYPGFATDLQLSQTHQARIRPAEDGRQHLGPGQHHSGPPDAQAARRARQR